MRCVVRERVRKLAQLAIAIAQAKQGRFSKKYWEGNINTTPQVEQRTWPVIQYADQLSFLSAVLQKQRELRGAVWVCKA